MKPKLTHIFWGVNVCSLQIIAFRSFFVFFFFLLNRTSACSSVCLTRLKQRVNTGSQYGLKPDCSAVATLDKHSSKGKRFLSSSRSEFHFSMSGGISLIMYSGLFKLLPTESARVPTASYKMSKFFA